MNAFRLFALTTALLLGALWPRVSHAANPIVTNVFTADPAALVHGDTVYIYAGQDEAPPNTHYRMNRWLCFSSKNMKTWKAEGSPLQATDFSWASGEAWASQVIEKNGKFFWFSCVEHKAPKGGKAIGVAVSDSPTGPFKDARGTALVTADMTSSGGHGHEDIDPTVFTDADGQSYLFWGNSHCFYAKLKPNMLELDGPILPVELPWFTEAPYIHKRGNLYYLSYASYFPEKIAYATSSKITGPWTYRGILAEVAGNSNTIHQSIIEFKRQWYFVYHNGSIGDSYRRSVCVDYLFYNPDGTLRRVNQTSEGTDLPPVEPQPPSLAIVPSWNRIQTASGNLFVRHADYKGLVSPPPIKPYADSMWKEVRGLSDARGVSFESLGFRGHFLRRQGNEVVLAKNDGSPAFHSGATFWKVPGLSDATASSFRAFDAPNLVLRHSNGVLRMEPVSTPSEKAQATFRITNEGGSAVAPATPAAANSVAPHAASPVSWINPILSQRADPHVTLNSDNYYFTASVPEYDRIELRRARTIGQLSASEPKTIWRRPASGPMSGFIWAPELHRIGGKWYLYFSAGRGNNIGSIRLFVLENSSADPFSGTWTERGQIKTNWDSFSLDATTFEHRGTRYLSWSQDVPGVRGTNLYLARMDTPWSIIGSQTLLSAPTLPWERIGHNVNEAPAALIKNGRVFLTYSASATDANYCLGMLTANANADLLDAKSWRKSPEPVLRSAPNNSQFGPGHNSFTTTPDGKTDILVYHARSYERIVGDSLFNPDRATRAQIVRWKADGTPDFGVPVADGPFIAALQPSLD